MSWRAGQFSLSDLLPMIEKCCSVVDNAVFSSASYAISRFAVVASLGAFWVSRGR
jgi:hypothetical protein